MANTVARPLMALVAAALTALLAGCVPTSDFDGRGDGNELPTSASPSPAPTPTPTATPTPDVRVTDIEVTAETIKLHNGDGVVVSTFDYFQPAEDVIAGLTAAFGASPTSAPYRVTHAAGIKYSWDGFDLHDEEVPTEVPHSTNYWVLVAAPDVNGVSVRTVDGIAVGDSAPELEAAYPETATRVTVSESERLDVYVGVTELPPMDDSADFVPTFSVFIIAEDPEGTVTDFRAPSPNWGA